MKIRSLSWATLLIVVAFQLASRTSWAQESPRLAVQALMTEAEFRAAGLQRLTPEEVAQLNIWLNKFAAVVAEATRDAGAAQTSPPNAGAVLSLEALEGAVIVAKDGQPLGLISSNCFKSDSLCNEFGKYGNEFNANSIRNEFGQYGSEFSSKSPFNEFTSTPPRIFKNGKAIAYLTMNTALSPRVDPLWLLAALRVSR